MPFLFFDSSMILLIPGLLLAIYAKYKVSSTFKKYTKVLASSGMRGCDVAQQMLEDNGIYNVEIIPISGSLTDHYDPRSKSVALSEDVFSSCSIAALSVAAHEVGHAIQDHLGYSPLSVRTAIFPIANFGSSAAFFFFIIGLFMNYGILLHIGIGLFTFAVAFQIITLPVEFNASKRALAYLKTSGFVSEVELPRAKSVLTAAAMTYVAATLMAVLQLVRMLIISSDD